MALTLQNLRDSLTVKGYSVRNTTTTDDDSPKFITVHFHPLFLKPILLIGGNNEQALSYQEQLVREALRRR